MPWSGMLAAPKTDSSTMKERLLHHKERDRIDGWSRGPFLTVRGPCKEVADTGAPSCEDALYPDVWDAEKRQHVTDSLLDTSVWEGHKGPSGRQRT